jgi:electron transport complex protein RnfE
MSSTNESMTNPNWRDNRVWHQRLGLFPLLAVTTGLGNSVALALVGVLVLVTSNVAISALRSFRPSVARLPAFMLVVGFCTTGVLLLTQAYAFDIYERIALFVQIIITNCIILGHAERVAQNHATGRALIDSVITGLGFVAALLVVGATREVIAFGLPVALLPPGAFLVAGLVLAAKNLRVSRA